MAEQEPLRASGAVVMSVPRKGLWPRDKGEASVAVDKAMLSRYPLKHRCLCMGFGWSTSEPWPWINPWQSRYSLEGTVAVSKDISTCSVDARDHSLLFV